MNLEELKQFMTEVEAHINDSSNDYGLRDIWYDLVYKTKDDMSIIIENRHSERTGDDYDYCEEVYYIEFNGKSCFIEFGGYYNSWDGRRIGINAIMNKNLFFIIDFLKTIIGDYHVSNK